jgi:hypothetical protein
MNILSESERAALLQALTEAPDEVLIDAVRQRKDWMKNIKSSFDEVRSFVGMKVTESSKPPPHSTPVVSSTKVVAEKAVEVAPTERPNVNPGRSTITKIGTDTKSFLLGELQHGRISAKHTEHYKLLHSRGEVKYDGNEYYL